jgi:hypothetical protein
MIRRVTVCGLVKAFRAEALGKPSVNSANLVVGGRRETW